jgi:hypothetical protein
VRRLQTAEAALKDQRQFERLLDARRRRHRLKLLVVSTEKSSEATFTIRPKPAGHLSGRRSRQLPLPKMRVAVLPKMRVTELRDAPPVLGKFTW